MVSPRQDESLLLCLTVFDHAVSAGLLVTRARQQHIVYYVSRVLRGAQLQYLLIEKFPCALLIASRKLRPYFESHHVTVLTDQPRQNTLEKCGSSRENDKMGH